MKKPVTVDIAPEVADALERSECRGVELILPEMDNTLYGKCKKVIEILGGKWNKKAKAHLFSSDCAEIIKAALDKGGVVDEKKTYQLFETPEALAREMIGLLNLQEGSYVLEPSAGCGAIAKHLPEFVKLTMVELNPKYAQIAADACPRALVHFGDFLAFNAPVKYDAIIMNPPFSKLEDTQHVMRAYDMLKPGGRMVAIMSLSSRHNNQKKAQAFRDWLDTKRCERTEIPEGTFKDTGTMIKTELYHFIKN